MHKPWGAGLAFGGELLSVLGGTGAGASALVVGGGGGTASVRAAALLGSSNSVVFFSVIVEIRTLTGGGRDI
jgi:hypothetical protein